MTSGRTLREEVNANAGRQFSLQDCEEYIRRTWPQHRLDVAVGVTGSDRYRVRLAVETPRLLWLFPDIDLDGIAMLVYLVRWTQARPLPVSSVLTTAWKTIMTSAADYEARQLQCSAPAATGSLTGQTRDSLGRAPETRLNQPRWKRWVICSLALLSLPLTIYLRNHTVSHGHFLPWDPKLLPLMILEVAVVGTMIALLLSGRKSARWESGGSARPHDRDSDEGQSNTSS